jgi:hypothetical protein
MIPFDSNPDLSNLDIDSWFIEPPGMLCVHRMTRFEPTHASEVAGVFQRMLARFPRTKGFVHVHDFSKIGGYTSAGRVAITRLGLEYYRQGSVLHVYVVMPPTRSIIRMGIQTAVMSLRVSGIKIDAFPSLESVINQVNLRHHEARR